MPLLILFPGRHHVFDIYFQEGIMCLIEPLNTRITAPNYFLSNLHTGKLFKQVSSLQSALLFFMAPFF